MKTFEKQWKTRKKTWKNFESWKSGKKTLNYKNTEVEEKKVNALQIAIYENDSFRISC